MELPCAKAAFTDALDASLIDVFEEELVITLNLVLYLLTARHECSRPVHLHFANP
jgi:hypothetical protein